MSRAKRLRRLVPLAVGVLVAVACGGPQEPGSAGTDCFRDDDCEPGLVCASLDPAVPGDRVCTNDVSGLVSTVPGPVSDAGVPPEGQAGAPAMVPAGGAPNSGEPPAAGAPSQPPAGGAPSTPPPGGAPSGT
jgi:hypothetical protein